MRSAVLVKRRRVPGSPRLNPARKPINEPKREVAELIKDSPGMTKTQFEAMLAGDLRYRLVGDDVFSPWRAEVQSVRLIQTVFGIRQTAV